MLVCQKHKQSNDNKAIPIDSMMVSSRPNTKERGLSTLLGIDSVSDADNYFVGKEVDSISISKLHFEAIYLTCFKAVVRYELYAYLKNRFPLEYNAIKTIHTQHSISVDNKVFSFNAIGSYGCHSIPESSLVAVDSKVLSLFSKNNHLGKVIILDSIIKIK
jgi:hypothetical protein